MEVSITKENVKNMRQWINNGKLVRLMNDEGTDFVEMMFIIDAINKAILDAEKFFEEKGDEET